MAEKWLHRVAKSGNYNELENKPESLPADGGNADTVNNRRVDDSEQSTDVLWTGKKIKDELDKKANSFTTLEPTVIKQNMNYRFITDAERNKWNSMQTTPGPQGPPGPPGQDGTTADVVDDSNNGLMSPEMLEKLNNSLSLNGGEMKGSITFQNGENGIKIKSNTGEVKNGIHVNSSNELVIGDSINSIIFNCKHSPDVITNYGRHTLLNSHNSLICSQGDWTPIVYSADHTSEQITDLSTAGSYFVKVGKRVEAYFYIRVNSFPSKYNGSGILIKGFPYAIDKNKVEVGFLGDYEEMKYENVKNVKTSRHNSANVAWLTRDNGGKNTFALRFGTDTGSSFLLRGCHIYYADIE